MTELDRQIRILTEEFLDKLRSAMAAHMQGQSSMAEQAAELAKQREAWFKGEAHHLTPAGRAHMDRLIRTGAKNSEIMAKMGVTRRAVLDRKKRLTPTLQNEGDQTED